MGIPSALQHLDDLACRRDSADADHHHGSQVQGLGRDLADLRAACVETAAALGSAWQVNEKYRREEQVLNARFVIPPHNTPKIMNEVSCM